MRAVVRMCNIVASLTDSPRRHCEVWGRPPTRLGGAGARNRGRRVCLLHHVCAESLEDETREGLGEHVGELISRRHMANSELATASG